VRARALKGIAGMNPGIQGMNPHATSFIGKERKTVTEIGFRESTAHSGTNERTAHKYTFEYIYIYEHVMYMAIHTRVISTHAYM